MDYREYDVIADVYSGIALPSEEKYKVMIKLADYELVTENPLFAQKHYNRWNCRFRQSTYKAPYLSAAGIGKVFVYLMQGSNPICYYSANIEEFLDNPNPPIRWVELKNDLSVGKVDDSHKAGVISFRLAINERSKGKIFNFEEQ